MGRQASAFEGQFGLHWRIQGVPMIAKLASAAVVALTLASVPASAEIVVGVHHGITVRHVYHHPAVFHRVVIVHHPVMAHKTWHKTVVIHKHM
jgi:hypothetical protein